MNETGSSKVTMGNMKMKIRKMCRFCFEKRYGVRVEHTIFTSLCFSILNNTFIQFPKQTNKQLKSEMWNVSELLTFNIFGGALFDMVWCLVFLFDFFFCYKITYLSDALFSTFWYFFAFKYSNKREMKRELFNSSLI